MKSNHVTVVIVNYNSWNYLEKCLDCLLLQTVSEFQVIVIDNASTQPHSDFAFAKYPWLKLIKNSKNIGFAAANNQAIQLAAQGEWLVLLNPDTLPEPTWLENLLNAGTLNPQYTAFGSRLLMADNPEILDGDGDVYHVSGLVWRYKHREQRTQTDEVQREIFSPCAAAAMYRRDALTAVGGFDEDFFCYCEDVDLGFRLRLQGHRCLSVPSSVVKHHGSAITGVKSDFSLYHGHRNLVWTWVKNMPIGLLLLFFPLHVLYSVACVLLYAGRGQAGVVLRAKWDALKAMNTIWKKRRRIQAGATVSAYTIYKVLNASFCVGPKSKFKKV